MKKLLSSLFTLFYLSGYSQNNSGDMTRAERNMEFNERPLKERMAYGGEFTMYFGGLTYITLSPFAAYRLTPDICFGIGPNYQYISVRSSNINGYPTYRDNRYGGRIFLRHEIGRMFFAHAEYEVYNLKSYSQVGGWGRRNTDIASLGIGYKSSLGGDFAYYYIMLLYDFIQNPSTQDIYFSAPIIFKMGMIFGK